MSLPKYVFTDTDEFGDMAVIDDDKHRILSFGAGDEQSVQIKDKPHLLAHAYTQAMLLSLLFCEPKRVLILGLGAGSLFCALHHQVPGVRIHAVELRQKVIDIAKRYFRLPSSKKLTLSCSDALEYLQQPVVKKVDLILTDLYDAYGMKQTQISDDYILLCSQQLKVDGWLVFNCWGRTDDHPQLFDKLAKAFADVRSCESGDGNLIIFAGKQKDTKSHSQLKTLATKLGNSLGFDLQRFMNKLQ